MPVRVKRSSRLVWGILFLLIIIAALLLYAYPRMKGPAKILIVEAIPARESVRLFFASNRQTLSSKSFDLQPNTPGRKRGEAIIEELKKEKSIPERTRLLDLAFGSDDILYINLTREFIDGQSPSGNEVTTVYSLVNSLTSAFKEMKKVQLLIEGQAVYTVNGIAYTYLPLEFNKDLVEE